MANELYRIGDRAAQPKRRRHWIVWFIALLVIGVLAVGWWFVRTQLKPHTVIKQSKAVVHSVDVSAQTKHYDEPDFGIDLPITWVPLPRPEGPYQSFSWSSGGTSDVADLVIYEDTIPANFQVNKVQIVSGQDDHVQFESSLSDDCTTFTRDLAVTTGEYGVQAKWQNVAFICDRSNTERDVIGTSSASGINTVILKSPLNNAPHKFFFTFTNHSVNPNYEVFTNAVTSLRMK